MSDPNKCRKLLGVTSSGSRIRCGKTVVTQFADRCPNHSEFKVPTAITCEVSEEVAEKLVARSEAYGIELGQLIGRMLELGIQMGLDMPQ